MRKIEILGKTIGKIYVKDYIDGHNSKYLCVCPCGEEFQASSYAIRKKRTDCGCGAVTGIHKKPFKVGDIYCGCRITDVSKAYEKQTCYTFICSKCGEKSKRVHSDFLKFPLCQDCLKKEISAKKREKAHAEFAGKTINGIKVLGVSGQDKYGAFLVSAICPVCGKEFETRISRIKLGIASCDRCGEKGLDIGREIAKSAAVDGTSVLCIQPDRALNRNNTTGHTGVSLYANGKYRAYINFKRKQYHLGMYDTLEQATAARKQAEKEIYGNFLDWYAREYPEQWEKINRPKKS